MVKTITALSHADLGYLVFFSDAFIACVPWYQSINRTKKDNRKVKSRWEEESTKEKQEQERRTRTKKGYTAANGYFGFNAVAQLGPGIQK